MKATVKMPVEIEVSYIHIHVPVRYDDEDIANDFPLRDGDYWEAMVRIDNGEIVDWPQGQKGEMYLKVVDGGTYTLFDNEEKELTQINDYVPHGIVPGKYGDYIHLIIDEKGLITNWPKKPSLEDFYGDDED